MLIITRKGKYRWDVRRFLKHLLCLGVGIAWIVAFFYLSNLDYLDAIR